MSTEEALEQYISQQLMALLPKVQERLSEGETMTVAQGLDLYVSAVVGHVFTVLVSGLGQGVPSLNRSPESVGHALNVISQKLSVIAQAVDVTGNYRIQILRQAKPA